MCDIGDRFSFQIGRIFYWTDFNFLRFLNFVLFLDEKKKSAAVAPVEEKEVKSKAEEAPSEGAKAKAGKYPITNSWNQLRAASISWEQQEHNYCNKTNYNWFIEKKGISLEPNPQIQMLL